MFLAKDRRLGLDNFVFTQQDPRSEGFKGEVLEGVQLEYDLMAVSDWPQGTDRPDPRLGRDPSNPKQYKVFKFPQELQAAGYEEVGSNLPFVVYSWSEYRKRYYPTPEEYAKTMTSDEWFDFLEETDVAAKLRKKLDFLPMPPKGSSPDVIAEWIVKQHMDLDSGISQIWFLPSESPDNEIRLLEVSEHVTGDSAAIKPIDFAMDFDGQTYRLCVADVSEVQLNKVKQNPAKVLPTGWKLDDTLIWNRRGRQQ